MAVFEVKMPIDKMVQVELTYSYLLSSTWRVVSGDSSILRVNRGTWTYSAAGKRVILYDGAGRQLAYFDHVGVVRGTWSADPFRAMSAGDNGDGLFLFPGAVSGGLFGWRLLSK
jgi:hypothetical protein